MRTMPARRHRHLPVGMRAGHSAAIAHRYRAGHRPMGDRARERWVILIVWALAASAWAVVVIRALNLPVLV